MLPLAGPRAIIRPAWRGSQIAMDRMSSINGRSAMILGMSIATFTFVHTALSLVGIFAGLIAVWGILGSRLFERWTALFLATTVLTSVTGFFFPRDHVLPSHIVGVISLVVLTIAILALYRYRLAASWRRVYIVSAIVSLYLNVFVGVVQAFQKIPSLATLAPTQSEPPFVIAQAVVLLGFVGIAIFALRSFRPGSATAASPAA
jgi:hypothetical protein